MSRYLLMLMDGPCLGSYEVARAPITLRAVVSATGKKDVLDLLEDAPGDDEEVFVYRRHGAAGHACMRGPTRCLTTLDYHYVGALDRDTGEVLAPTADERAWWETQRVGALRAWGHGNPPPATPPRHGRLFA
jgi:hypothetical protein